MGESGMWDNEGVAVDDIPGCPLCGGEGRDLYRDLRDRYWRAPGVWSLRACQACGHIWLSPRPLPEEVGKLYGAYYTHSVRDRRRPSVLGLRLRQAVLAGLGYAPRPVDRRDAIFARFLPLFPLVRESVERELRFVRGPPRGALLDIGCGDGSFLAEMRDLGWRVVGLEPDPVAAEVARDRGVEVIQSPIESADLAEGRFDAVTMNHVIEHVTDPVRALDLCRRALREEGAIVIVTPNARSWGHRRFREAWFHLDPPRHLHLFTAENLRRCANRAGLHVTGMRTCAAGAQEVRQGSRAIRATGRFEFPQEQAGFSPGDRAFRYAEWALARVSPEAGEELLVFGSSA